MGQARLPRALMVVVLAVLCCTASAHAAFPGANGKIAYNAYDQPGIWAINFDGTGDTQLTTDGAQAEWSPDGMKLAYVRCLPACHIWTANADGSGQAQATNGAGEVRPSWSPDGSRFVFLREGAAFEDQIWTSNTDGTGEALVAGGLETSYTPQWSPDGTKIAFDSAHRPQNPPRTEIYTVHPDGTGLTRLTTASGQIFPCNAYPQDTSSPEWSPDGNTIAYLYFHDEADGECTGGRNVHMMSADGTGDREFAPFYAYIYDPERLMAWSPDGTMIGMDLGGVTYVIDVATRRQMTEDWLVYGVLSDWQPLPINAYPRPRGASPSYLSLVPAYAECSSPDRTHGSPLSFPSCATPSQASGHVTVGTPDANGRPATSIGYAVLTARADNLTTPADESDVKLRVSITDVRQRSDLSDYAGELEARPVIRITDRDNTPSPGGPGAATTVDLPFPYPVACTTTAAVNTGSVCATATTAEAVVPGSITGGRRAVWELGQMEIEDGGADGLASTPGDNTLFLKQGLFVP